MKKTLIAMLMALSFTFNTGSIPFSTPLKTEISNLDYSHRRNPSHLPFVMMSRSDYQILLSNKIALKSTGNLDQTSQLPVETTPDAITVTLSFAGDCTMGDDEKYQWNTFDEVYEQVKDPTYFFKGVQDVFSNDDYTFINFEGTFTKETQKAEKLYRFKGDPSYVDILTKGSIEGVTLCNNHSLDYLQKGFDDTVYTLNKANIDYAYFDTYFIKEIKGVKIGFLGYKGWEHEKRSNTLLVKHVKEMQDQNVDYIVANYHWGDEKSYVPNALQRRMAHFAIDNGVDLVIGHHPHVLQGMEVYKSKNIVYSLGNFCFGGAPNPSDKDTIIYQHILRFDAKNKKITGTEHKIIPAKVSSEVSRNNYQPTIATGDEAQRIIKKYESLCTKIR